MALIAHQSQGSYPNIFLKTKPWSKWLDMKYSVAFQLVGRADHVISVKHRFHSRDHPVCWTKGRPFKIKSFKGNAQNSESDSRDGSTKSSKTTFQLSPRQNERDDLIKEMPRTENHQLSYTSEGQEDTMAGSRSIQNIFRKWLIILRTQTSSSQTMDINVQKEQIESEIYESKLTSKAKAGQMMKVAFMFFLSLDAAITLPLLIFIPWYLMVKVVYGAEVVKELTPLWILGPIIVALYIKIVQALISLYIHCFTQAIRLVKDDLPAYFCLAYSYVAEGKLKAFLWACFCQPMVDIKNLDYGDLLKQKLKELQTWAGEKYLDYVESIWPYYCRTIRFLKKANLI